MLTRFNQGVCFFACLAINFFPSPVHSQSIISEPNSTGTIVNQQGNLINISGGTQAGGNLFHSFIKLGLQPQEIANFLSQPGISNILGRVTGGDVSVIEGLIRVIGGDANLFLMNPAGIVFGANSRLDVPGSFTATTANAIGFDDGWFHAFGDNEYDNLTGSPKRFAFSGDKPGVIVNHGDLSAANLNLIGGTVVSVGSLNASGNITAAAVPGGNTVRLSQKGAILGLEVPATAVKQGINPLDVPALLTTPVEVTTGDVVIGGTVTADTVNLGAANRVKLENNGEVITGNGQFSAPTVTIFPESETDPLAYIFLDATVPDYEAFLYNGKPGTTTVVVTPEESGITVISKQLTVISESGNQIDEVHIVSEGNEGNFWLGKDFVSSTNIEQYQAQLATWDAALGVGADILIYACLAALGDRGQTLLNKVAAYTGADVAGSTNLTGAESLGGDWLLERSVGNVEASTPWLLEAVDNYNDTLQIFTVANNNDNGTGSLREAIVLANQNIEADEIRFDSGFFDGFQGVILLTSGELSITATEDLKIDGAFGDAANVVVDGNNASRVFNITGSGDVTFESVTVQNGNTTTVGSSGGGISNTGGGALTISNSTISGNFSSNRGGGIFSRSFNGNSQIMISNSTISSNSSNFSGGGIYSRSSNDDSQITVSNSTISGNSSTTEGGGIFSSSSNGDNQIIVNNSTISGNSADNIGGGGIHGSSFTGDIQITVNNSTISGNSAGNRGGGGIYGSSSNGDIQITVNNSTISGNSADNRGGGGIHGSSSSGNSQITVSNSTISGNSSTGDGGGIYGGNTSGDSQITIINSTISGNSSTREGGGIRGRSSFGNNEITVSNSIISDNSTGNIGGGGISGGGSSSDDNQITISNSTISGNSSTGNGGGISIRNGNDDSQITVSNSIISSNSSTGDGGGISIRNGYGNSQITVSNSTISSNSSTGDGGGISVRNRSDNNQTTVSSSTISGNSAIRNGGGISVRNSNGDNQLTVSNSTISGNSAIRNGGGIYGNSSFDDGQITVSSSTIFDNSADSNGGGIFIDATDKADIFNTIIAGNSGASSPDVSGNFNDQGNNLIGISDGSTGFTISSLVGTSNNPLDPLLAPLGDNGGTTQTHALLPGSPAINAGSNNNAPATDQRGVIRDTQVDIGAFEFTGSNVSVITNPTLIFILNLIDNLTSDPTSTLTLTQTPLATIDNTLIPPEQKIPLEETKPLEEEELLLKINPIDIEAIEERFSSTFTNYLETSETTAINLQQAQNRLATIEAKTGIKPALIYATFAPTSADTPVNQDSSLKQQASKTKQSGQLLWQSTQQGFNTAQELSISNQQASQDNYQLELILVAATGETIRYPVERTTKAEVIKQMKRFRRAVSNPSRNAHLKLGQQFYQWLVTPLETELQQREIDNLVFILDEGLRSVPLAAMMDGEQFIIEKYSVGLMPSLSLTDTRYVDIRNLQVLAMGAETFTEKSSLPAVPKELSLVTNQLWSGTSYLNQEFTLANLTQARNETPYGIIHLATHGEFKPGKPGNSYIQLWDEKLPLDNLRTLGWNNPPVELLILSACRTAIGNREAELGFAGFAVQAGVKSALGSLWTVSDEGTLGLMSKFYQKLKTAPIKAEALRQAQLGMLRGEVYLEDGQLISGDRQIPLPKVLGELGYQDLSHPYYWSGFTMIGNPW